MAFGWVPWLASAGYCGVSVAAANRKRDKRDKTAGACAGGDAELHQHWIKLIRCPIRSWTIGETASSTGWCWFVQGSNVRCRLALEWTGRSLDREKNVVKGVKDESAVLSRGSLFGFQKHPVDLLNMSTSLEPAF